jgi:predicted glycosyltransferase
MVSVGIREMNKRNIWIDIDNSPHVLFFDPIVRRLREAGHQVVITARACRQTHGLLELHSIPFFPVGRHYGKGLVPKVFGLGLRSLQLLRFARRRGIDLAVSHGSRSLVGTSYLMRIPCVTLYDYEHVFTGIFNRFSTKVVLPELIPDQVLQSIGLDARKVAKYPGFKEEVYLGDFQPDPDIYGHLGIEKDQVLVTLRPPATMAHYHSPRSEVLFEAALRHVLSQKGTVAVVLPRTEDQGKELLRSYANHHSLVIPQKPVDGLNLLWHSDLVISGGGTMNREAALLGVPVFSVFSGKQGVVDQTLAQQGKLHFLQSVEDVQRVVPRKREGHLPPPQSNHRVIEVILQEILTTGQTANTRR